MRPPCIMPIPQSCVSERQYIFQIVIRATQFSLRSIFYNIIETFVLQCTLSNVNLLLSQCNWLPVVRQRSVYQLDIKINGSKFK
jgi:hypothetical protein